MIWSTKSSIVAILESKIKLLDRLKQRTPANCEAFHNLTPGGAARIWSMWDGREWKGRIQHSSEQLIVLNFTNKGGFEVIIGAVYGHNYKRLRCSLWEDIIKISAEVDNQTPLLISGDFNDVLAGNKKGGRLVPPNILQTSKIV